MAIKQKLFSQADLNGTNQLIYTHNLNTGLYVPVLYDGDGLKQKDTEFWFNKGDENGDSQTTICTVSFTDPIVGEYELLLEYTSSGESGGGRRAFEMAENNSPDDSMRLIGGKADTPSFNITFANLYVWLLGKLGFLKISENLNDLANKATARGNLGVYSSTEVNNALSGKASLYQTLSGAVLGVANTAVYTPTAQYHPAVLKTVTDAIQYSTVGGTFRSVTVNQTLTTGDKVITAHTGSPITITLSNSVPTGHIIVIKRGDIGGLIIQPGSGATFQPTNSTPITSTWVVPDRGDSLIIAKSGSAFLLIGLAN